MLGFDAVGRLALGQIGGRRTVSAVMAAAGVGALTGVGRSTFSGVMVSSGFGALTVAGTGIFSSAFSATGAGALSGVMYGFYSDAEVAVVMEEPRVTYAGTRSFFDVDIAVVAEEPRTASIAFEDRVMVVEAKQTAEIGAEPRTAGLPNRLRKT